MQTLFKKHHSMRKVEPTKNNKSILDRSNQQPGFINIPGRSMGTEIVAGTKLVVEIIAHHILGRIARNTDKDCNAFLF